ncbi:hypothetical protein MMC25_005579 [Agyrium rufum]|nr:hypothetical protein [Agyrium rufum]
MADTEVTPAERKPRKSVAFSDGATIMDANGDVTETNGTSEDKSTAESHTATPSEAHSTADKTDNEVDELNDLFKGLSKKKKPKKAKDEGAEATNGTADGEFDPSALKKKKKPKAAKAADASDFDAKLAEAGVTDETEKEAAVEEIPEEVAGGDMEKGTGIWAHNAAHPISYDLLLSRFFDILQNHHPDLMSSGSKSYKIPPPQCLREGNKKTIFANIADICKRMKRTDEHVTQFLFAELGTNGSVDGSRRLVIKGRFQQKQIENVLRRYIVEYVTCKTCRSPDTELSKGENRLYFVTCNSCGSRRSVTAIKTGFSAQVGKRRRQQA